jgi:WD40 repeat protein
MRTRFWPACALALAAALGGGSAATARRDKAPPKLAEAQGVTRFEYAPDGSFVAMDYRTAFFNQPHRTDAVIGVWDAKTGECRVTVEKPLKQFERLAVSPDGKKLAAVSIVDKQVRVWDAATGKVLDDQALPAWKNRILMAPFLKFSPDGKLLYTIRDRQILEITVGGKFRTFGAVPELAELGHAAIDPEAKRVVAAHNVYGKPAAELSVFDLAKDGAAQTVALTNHVRSLTFSPDGRTLAISYLSIGKPRLEMWDAVTWRLRGTAPADARKGFDGYRVLAFAPDAAALAGVPNFEKPGITIVDLLDVDGKLTGEVKKQSLKATALTYSPDGKTLAAQLNNYSVMFIDPATGEEKKP